MFDNHLLYVILYLERERKLIKKYKYNKIYDIIKLRNKKMFPDSP